MPEVPRKYTYFVSDVHLGLKVGDAAAREKAFTDFLAAIDPAQTDSLYLLGDIWDFWYEYRDVVPKGYVRVFSALIGLMDAGVRVCFFPGNHDIWTYSYFQSLGMEVLRQPYFTEIGGKRFCLGHGDGLGPVDAGYRVLRCIFHCRVLQVLFSTLHPWLAFRLGNAWSKHSRLGRKELYSFRGQDEPLYKFCERQKADYFVFGHYHCKVDMPVGDSARLFVLPDWINGQGGLRFDSLSDTFQEV